MSEQNTLLDVALAKTEGHVKRVPEFDVHKAAQWFAALDSTLQGEFLVEAAQIISSQNAHRPECGKAWSTIGKHLAGCECTTPEAQRAIKELAAGLEEGRELVRLGKRELI